ncbi:MAG: FAD-dependent oxidoreductase [Alphaproteobacteria bacterium]|nr:FAD-dependent oxidoreductase [Alphaproteobacteria bacterium]
MPQLYDVVVIGSGPGEMIAAALLARAGRNTLLIERNHSLGGAASTYKVADLLIEGFLHEASDLQNALVLQHARHQRCHVVAHHGLVGRRRAARRG